MNYDFFANSQDKIDVRQFIFTETDLQVFDHYSAYGEKVSQYKTTNDITSKFDLTKGGKFAVNFQLWKPSFGGNIIYREIALNPKYCNGHSFRFATGGWGLIQLYFGGVKNNELNTSHLGHFNQKGALKREPFNDSYGNVSDWDWTEIEKTSRKLKYQIHNKMAIRKTGSLGILPGADNLSKQGIVLR